MKKFPAKWAWFMAHIGLPVTAAFVIWIGLQFTLAYPLYADLRAYPGLFVANIACILGYVLQLIVCISAMVLMLKKRKAWKKILTLHLVLLPIATMLQTYYNTYFLNYIESKYAPAYNVLSYALVYAIWFLILSLPTLLILRKFTYAAPSAAIQQEGAEGPLSPSIDAPAEEEPVETSSPVEEKQTPSGAATPPDAAEEIRKYAKLLEDGIITQEEFSAKKKQLLGL